MVAVVSFGLKDCVCMWYVHAQPSLCLQLQQMQVAVFDYPRLVIRVHCRRQSRVALDKSHASIGSQLQTHVNVRTRVCS
jgi:hypothetical protein